MKNNIIEYSIGDTLKSAIKFVTNLENDSIMRFVISNNDTSYPIIDKTFLMDNNGIFTVELTPSERKKLTLGQYVYKIIINGVDGSIKTRQSGYFRVIWGAAEDNVLNVSTGYQTKLTFDSVPTKGSTNPVTSDGIYNFVKDNPTGGGSIIVDDKLSMDSENPVQNKVITQVVYGFRGELNQMISSNEFEIYLVGSEGYKKKVDKVDGYGLVAVWN